MRTEDKKQNTGIFNAGFLFRAALILLSLLLAAAVRLPSQIRAYTYELYREMAGAHMNFRARDLPSIEGKYVKVVYRGEDAGYAPIVLEASEKFYRPVAEKYGFKSSEKVTVVVYPTKEELNASFGWPASESAMGVYWAGVIRVLSPATWAEGNSLEEMRESFINTGPMAHELTHLAVDYATRGNCPRWFTEGLAQLEEYRLTGFRFSYQSGFDSEGFYSLKEMDGNFDGLPDQALAYREALSAVEYIDTVYGEEKLREIVRLLGSGRGMGQSLKMALGVDQDTFEQNWRTWSGF